MTEPRLTTRDVRAFIDGGGTFGFDTAVVPAWVLRQLCDGLDEAEAKSAEAFQVALLAAHARDKAWAKIAAALDVYTVWKSGTIGWSPEALLRGVRAALLP